MRWQQGAAQKPCVLAIGFMPAAEPMRLRGTRHVAHRCGRQCAVRQGPATSPGHRPCPDWLMLRTIYSGGRSRVRPKMGQRGERLYMVRASAEATKSALNDPARWRCQESFCLTLGENASGKWLQACLRGGREAPIWWESARWLAPGPSPHAVRRSYPSQRAYTSPPVCSAR